MPSSDGTASTTSPPSPHQHSHHVAPFWRPTQPLGNFVTRSPGPPHILEAQNRAEMKSGVPCLLQSYWLLQYPPQHHDPEVHPVPSAEQSVVELSPFFSKHFWSRHASCGPLHAVPRSRRTLHVLSCLQQLHGRKPLFFNEHSLLDPQQNSSAVQGPRALSGARARLRGASRTRGSVVAHANDRASCSHVQDVHRRTLTRRRPHRGERPSSSHCSINTLSFGVGHALARKKPAVT